MFRLTRSHPLPIGLDLGHESIKMLQLEASASSLSVLAAARRAIPADAPADGEGRRAVAIDLVRHTLRQGGFCGRNVAVALPWDIVHMKNLRLPPIPPAELEAAALFEARNVFGFDVDEATVHCLPAGEVRQGTETRQEVILLAVKNQEIENLLEQLHRIGLEVDALDVEPCALYRTIQRFIRRREDEQAVHVVVDVGRQRSQVAIGRGHEINFIKPLEIGGGRMHEAVSRKLGISLDEAAALRRRLADGTESGDANARRDSVRQAVHDATRGVMEELGREVSLCLRYYSVTFRGHRPSRVRLVGGEANDPQLQQVISAAMTIPVEVGRPLAGIDTSRMRAAERRGPMSEWCVAMGLGLKMTRGQFAGGGSMTVAESEAPAAPRSAMPAQVIDVMEAARAGAAEPAGAAAQEAVHA